MRNGPKSLEKYPKRQQASNTLLYMFEKKNIHARAYVSYGI